MRYLHKSATDRGIFMSSLPLRKQILPSMWCPKSPSYCISQTDWLFEVRQQKQFPTEYFNVWNSSTPRNPLLPEINRTMRLSYTVYNIYSVHSFLLRSVFRVPNSVTSCGVWSRSTLFAQACLSQYLGLLRWLMISGVYMGCLDISDP